MGRLFHFIVSALTLDFVLKLRKELDQKGRTLMAANQELQRVLQDLDQATTQVGDRIASLAAQVKEGMTPQEVANVKAQVEAEANRLRGFAADPANPVPTGDQQAPPPQDAANTPPAPADGGQGTPSKDQPPADQGPTLNDGGDQQNP